MKRLVLVLLVLSTLFVNGFSQRTVIQYLSGTDKDHTVQWDFFCTGGRQSGKWSKIAVPSNWELQGFGEYNYGHDKVKSNEQGQYKHEFPAGNWAGKEIYIVFEGSMTDTKVMINGKEAGPVHQGSFYRFKYNITALVKPNDKNLLEVTVDKTSANPSVNNAERGNSDFWIFGGIYRPVYLEVVPETFIDRLAIDARADGSFQMDVYPQHLKGGETVQAQVQTLAGENVGQLFSVISPSTVAATNTDDFATPATETPLRLSSNFTSPRLWTAESPNRYQVLVSIRNKAGVIHQVKQKFGFRTIELRTTDGFYINNTRVILKGVCRHSFWPETGRTLSFDIHLRDVSLMKEMNMNAVRMSHYPPDQEFLDVCDSLGLYVLDELTGWQARYDTVVGHKLVKEMVVHDVNHPSIIFWDNGNEGGWNRGLDEDYALYDPQKRTVIHPSEKFNGTDTHHYPDYNAVVKAAASGKEVFFPTEFMHGLYDGGAGACLDDFWNVILTHPHGAGGFIWALLDEAVVRTDKAGILDADGNHAPDGILGPHREKEGSFYTIKEVWSPVYIDPQLGKGGASGTPAAGGTANGSLDDGFTGNIPVGNRYAFTDLDACTFKWQLVSFPRPQDKSTTAIVRAMGTPAPIHVPPGGKGTLKLTMPPNWLKSDALYLTAYGPDKKEIFTWSWDIRAAAIHHAPANGRGTVHTPGSAATYAPATAAEPSAQAIRSRITTVETDSTLIVKSDGLRYYFDKNTGYIEKVVKPATAISLSGGPALAGVRTSLKQFTHTATNGQYLVKADYEGPNGSLSVIWTFRPDQAVRMDYEYSQTGDADFIGITFNYPEEKINGMKWLGRGPYRVWKNRLKGQRFGVWQKDYNNSITGETWQYPEFKGYHAQVNWVVISNKESPFTVYMSEKDIYLQMLHPARERDALTNNNVEPPFPDGSIGFLTAISPIGTKFHAAKVMGPQGQKNQADGGKVNGTLWFDFSK